MASFGILRGGDDGNGRVKQRVARKFRELDEDGEGISLADVATLLTDVLGRKLDRDAMLRLAANVFDNAEKSDSGLRCRTAFLFQVRLIRGGPPA